MRDQLSVRIGFAGGTALTSVDQVRSDVAWAGEAGFDSYWVSQVFGVDPLVALAAAGDAVTGIAEVGTSVMPFPGRHPIALAQQARTAQQACGGKLTLGVGPGHEVVVAGVYGQQWAKPLERTREYLDALVPLCSGEAADTSGSQISAHAELVTECDPVPVVLAALGPKMLELAGRTTHGTHVGSCGPKTIAHHVAPVIRAAAEDAGRPEPRIIALVSICVTDHPDAAIAHGRELLAGYAALPSYRAVLDREGVESTGDLMLAGSMDRIIDGLGEYVAAGVTDLRLGVAAPTAALASQTREALAQALAR